jgi:prevent-host-death family protein
MMAEVFPFIETRYNGFMVTTLHDGKAQFEALVERASHGEEVLITVDGKVKARLTAAEDSAALNPSEEFNGEKWWEALRALHRQFPATGRPMQEILDEMRADRI